MLFDLEKDPREQHDLSAQHPDIVRKMRVKMKEAHTDPVIRSFAL